MTLDEAVRAIRPVDADASAEAQRRLDAKTKPRGSLGRLEELARRLAGIRRDPSVRLGAKAVALFAADHGVADEGVSAYPREVTAQMVANIAAGGAAINVLAAAAGARVVVVDVGVCVPVAHPAVLDRRVRAGTANLARGPAMSRAEATRAVEIGIAIATELADGGVGVVGLGEMGIANTTAASAVTAVLTDRPVEEVVGRGTGIDDVTLARKRAAVAAALAANRPRAADPLGVLALVGGLELAALAGLVLGAAARRIPVVMDGFITGAAALAAARLAPDATGYLIAAHRSVEPGHRFVLDALSAQPLLDLQLRLGEGTGAALALPLLDAATRILHDMATFESAAVTDTGR